MVLKYKKIGHVCGRPLREFLKMVQAGGLEPPAYFLGGSRSILMSYACTAIFIKLNIINCKIFLFVLILCNFAATISKFKLQKILARLSFCIRKKGGTTAQTLCVCFVHCGNRLSPTGVFSAFAL